MIEKIKNMIEKINLMIIDNNVLLGECLASALSVQEHFSSVTLVSDSTTALRRIENLQRAVILININLPNHSALELSMQIRLASATVKIVMIGIAENESLIMKCVEAGANGYILEGGSFNELLEVIFSVNRGETICSPRVAGYGFSRLAELTLERGDQRSPGGCNLTPREMEILQLIADGMSNKQIAHYLHLSFCTVKNHVHNILEKLDVHTRVEAAYYATRNRLPRSRGVNLDHTPVLVFSKIDQR
jgi:two-component system NarL family response regulator